MDQIKCEEINKIKNELKENAKNTLVLANELVLDMINDEENYEDNINKITESFDDIRTEIEKLNINSPNIENEINLIEQKISKFKPDDIIEKLKNENEKLKKKKKNK